MKRKKLFRKWIITAPLGLILIGAGLSMLGEASFMKQNEAIPFWDWFTFGTLSLVVFNSGICFFGQAVIYRVKYEILINRKKS